MHILTSIATKLGAIVGGQTSCKAPEIAAFEKHLPPDVAIVSCHSLHGPGVNPKGQPLVLIKHRASDENFSLVEKILSCLQSKHVYLSAERHDRITADTQAVTHAAFLRFVPVLHSKILQMLSSAAWVPPGQQTKNFLGRCLDI